MISGNCPEGDTGSSLHLLFRDIEAAVAAGRLLKTSCGHFFSPTAVSANICWKWFSLLEDKSSAYNAADYLQTISILTRTLKMDIDFCLTLEETEQLGKNFRKLLGED